VKALLLPVDNSGCGYYRMHEPARAIRESGADIEMEFDSGLDVDGERTQGVTVLHSVNPHGADVVVFQRPTNMLNLDAMRMLQARGIACVVEIDDLMHGVSNAHAGYKGIIKDGAAHRVLQCAREADWVTVTSPALAREYGQHGRVSVIPNAIPRRIAELTPAYERPFRTLTVGWTGSVFTHPHDLQEVGTGLQTALTRSEGALRFAILGQAYGARERLGLGSDPIEYPWNASVDAYLESVGQLFDIGIAPLRDDKFNKSKSWLKPLEYAARGVYVIRSKVDEYERLGIGWRARSPKDWAQGITRAASDMDHRWVQTAINRETVLQKHLTEHTADLWLTAWRNALDQRARA
jgi:hypothetical protein